MTLKQLQAFAKPLLYEVKSNATDMYGGVHKYAVVPMSNNRTTYHTSLKSVEKRLKGVAELQNWLG